MTKLASRYWAHAKPIFFCFKLERFRDHFYSRDPPMAVGKSGLGFALAQSIGEIWHSWVLKLWRPITILYDLADGWKKFMLKILPQNFNGLPHLHTGRWAKRSGKFPSSEGCWAQLHCGLLCGPIVESRIEITYGTIKVAVTIFSLMHL